jgi:hypothetical protein
MSLLLRLTLNHCLLLLFFRGFKYEVQHGLKIHETPDVEF